MSLCFIDQNSNYHFLLIWQIFPKLYFDSLAIQKNSFSYIFNFLLHNCVFIFQKCRIYYSFKQCLYLMYYMFFIMYFIIISRSNRVSIFLNKKQISYVGNYHRLYFMGKSDLHIFDMQIKIPLFEFRSLYYEQPVLHNFET